MAKDSFAAVKPYYAAVKGSSMRQRPEPHSGEASFAAADPRAGFKIVLPSQWRSELRRDGLENLRLYFCSLRRCGLESLGNCVFAFAFKTHLSMKNKHRENAQKKNLTVK